MLNELPPPARYFPVEKGVYEVAPGLRTLGTSFGNGRHDEVLFQFDSSYEKYRHNRIAARAERLGKYVTTHDFRPEVARAVSTFLMDKLVEEHPALFSKQPREGGVTRFECRLTDEMFDIDSDGRLVHAFAKVSPPYASAFDALTSQLEPDCAIVSTERQPDGALRDWLAAINLCSPSHWAAEDKIGKNFFDIHVPVPGIEKINRAATSFVDAMINKGPYVRFVWGFATDTRLNHHPVPAVGADPAEWAGRSFDASRPGSPFVLRLERQALHPLPHVGAGLFSIHVFFIEGEEIRRNPLERGLLVSALRSMGPESREYKGLARDMDQVLAWLESAQ